MFDGITTTPHVSVSKKSTERLTVKKGTLVNDDPIMRIRNMIRSMPKVARLSCVQTAIHLEDFVEICELKTFRAILHIHINNNNNNNNNNRISIAPDGRNFRGAGGRSDQCSVKA